MYVVLPTSSVEVPTSAVSEESGSTRERGGIRPNRLGTCRRVRPETKTKGVVEDMRRGCCGVLTCPRPGRGRW